jgi:hypothetical protein
MPRGRILISKLDSFKRLLPKSWVEEDRVAETLSAALTNPGNAPAFFKALLNSKLHAFLMNGELVKFSDASGDPFIPVFSRQKFMPEAPEGSEGVEMNGRELLELARGKARIVINAGRKEFKAFGVQDIERILDKLVSSRFEV